MNASTFLSWIPGWLGFLLLILVGVAMVINGIANPNLDATNQLGFIDFGICAVVVGVVSWIAGGTSQIKGREGQVGVRVAVGNVPWWTWLIDIGAVVVAVVLFMILRD